MAYKNVMKKSYIFLIEHPVSLGNGSYYTGKVICKWQFMISFYAESFQQLFLLSFSLCDD